MPDLGDKHTCADCQTKYYDLGRPDATCPKCGSANRVTADSAAAATRTARPRIAPKAKIEPDEVADELTDELTDELADEPADELADGLPDASEEDVEEVELPEDPKDEEE